MSLTRRRLLQWCCTLPLLGAVARAVPERPRTVDENRLLAIRVLRFVNTLELWYKQQTAIYGSLTDLVTSEGFQILANHKDKTTYGIGSSLVPRLSVHGEEIVPGWKLKLRHDYDHYTVVIVNASTRMAFSSDDEGVIYEGVMIAGLETPDPDGGALEAIESATAIQSAGHPSFGVALKRAAARVAMVLLAVDPDRPINCCLDEPCECRGSCQQYPIPGLCTNCGCYPYPWCCLPY